MAGTNSSDEGGITGINVTPLVDVMLVLLIVFMVTANLINTKTIAVVLPTATTGTDASATTLHLEISRGGEVSLDGQKLDLTQLAAKLGALKAGAKPMNASIAADRAAAHGRVIDVVDLLRKAGITDFAFAVAAE